MNSVQNVYRRLKQLEWSGTNKRCSFCLRIQADGHNPAGCSLSAALNELERFMMSEIVIKYKGETLPLSEDELGWILTCVDSTQDNMEDTGDGLKPFLHELKDRLFRLVECGRIQEEINYG